VIALHTNPRTDPRLSSIDLQVLRVIQEWPGVRLGRDDIGFPVLSYVVGDGLHPTLDRLWQRTGLPKSNVFAAVARLEEFNYLPTATIR
jgi:hypothetical protein